MKTLIARVANTFAVSLRDRSGASSLELGVLTGVIVLGAVASASAMGAKLTDLLVSLERLVIWVLS